MAIARVTTWSSGQSLTASALNGEFDNIINNALALVSPWTGNMNAGGFTLQAIAAGAVGGPSIYFTGDSNTGFYSSAADTFDISSGGIRSASFATLASGVNYVNHTPAIATTGPIVSAAGSDTDISLNLSGKGLNGILFPANSGTPAVNNMYSSAVWKAWIISGVSGGVPSIAASYNVTSITDNAAGNLTVTWDRDFGNVNYVYQVTLENDGVTIVYPSMNSSARATTATNVLSANVAGALTDPGAWMIAAIGVQ